MNKIQLQLEAMRMAQQFCQWMMLVQGALLGTYARWLTTGTISPEIVPKALTFTGFGGSLVFASLRLGFLSDMTQRLGTTNYISELGISHSGILQRVGMSSLGVPQHVLFFIGLVGFAWSAWGLSPVKERSQASE